MTTAGKRSQIIKTFLAGSSRVNMTQMKDKIAYIKWAFSRASSPSGRRKVLSHPLLAWDFIHKLFFEQLLDEKKNLRSLVSDYRGTVSALARLSERLAAFPVPVIPLDDSFVDPAEATNCKALADLFSLHGSDKATAHNYHLIYSSVLKGKRNRPIRILEIGIGPNNVGVPSTIGRLGRPGPSLRAFRHWAPNSLVVGADVNRRILFSEERISTYHVDQL